MKFTRNMYIMIMSIIVIFFGGFLLLLNRVIPGSFGILNFFFGFFILVLVMITFAYIMSNQILSKSMDYSPSIGQGATNIKQTQTPVSKSGKMAALLCSSCGAQVSANDRFCLECGSSL